MRRARADHRIVRAVVFVLVLSACGRLGFDARTSPDGDPLETDAPETEAACNSEVDAEAVALYLLDDPIPADATGEHSGTTRMTVTTAPGRCGSASALFDTGYILVPDHAEFDLTTGSIEMFVRLSTLGAANQTFVARDALGTSEGHFIVLVSEAGHLITRLQRGNTSFYRCADFPLNTWVHVGVSFGTPGLRMWMNGMPATKSTATISGSVVDCTQEVTGGIDGNNNALLIGASNALLGEEGSPDPAVDQFVLGGTIDHVRLRNTWRDFGL